MIDQRKRMRFTQASRAVEAGDAAGLPLLGRSHGVHHGALRRHDAHVAAGASRDELGQGSVGDELAAHGEVRVQDRAALGGLLGRLARLGMILDVTHLVAVGQQQEAQLRAAG